MKSVLAKIYCTQWVINQRQIREGAVRACVRDREVVDYGISNASKGRHDTFG